MMHAGSSAGWGVTCISNARSSSSPQNCCSVSSPDSLSSQLVGLGVVQVLNHVPVKGLNLFLALYSLDYFLFFCSHLWTSWRAPELPICSPLLQPSAALQLGSSATCLSVEVPENNLEKDLFASAANFYFIRILSLLWISALTLVRHVFFSAVKLMKKYKKPIEMFSNPRWCTLAKNPQIPQCRWAVVVVRLHVYDSHMM